MVAWVAANRSLAAGKDIDIVDPMGLSPETHRRAAELIDEATAHRRCLARDLSGCCSPARCSEILADRISRA